MADLLAALPALEATLLPLRPMGLITDVDGVMAEIAPTAEEARVTAACKRHLRALSHRMEAVAVVSGRPIGAVRRMVGIRGVEYFGNNGVEHWRGGVLRLAPGAGAYRGAVAEAIRRLAPALEPHGVLLEDKGIGVAFHFAGSRDPEAARAATLRAVEGLEAARALVVGLTRRVIELRPPVSFHKGDAVRQVIREHGLRAAIYLGDDLPDLEAFRAVRQLGRAGGSAGIAVLVDNPGAPGEVVEAADYTLEGVPQVGRFLGWLARRLTPMGGAGAG